jgi:hypothetical protein
MECANEEIRNRFRRWIAPARLAFIAVLSLGLVASSVRLSSATGTITKLDLVGAWAATLTGDTGCGITTLYVTFTLAPSGSGTAMYQSHSSGCGDGTQTGVTFAIQSLSPNGSGTAGLSCGVSCGWTFNIQVSPDRSTFNLVDVSPANPGNYLEGTAIHQTETP